MKRLDIVVTCPCTKQFHGPPGTRYIRHGVTQEGFSVDYQDADGDWHGAGEGGA